MSHPPSGDERMLSAVVAHHLGSTPPDDACPDAETLAIYAEPGAARAELRRVEAHVASCLRCQAHVAALVRSEPPAAVATPSASFALAWRWIVPIASAALVVLAVWVVRAPVPTSQVDGVAEKSGPSASPDAAAQSGNPTAPARVAPESQPANELAAQAPSDARLRREADQRALSALEARDKAGSEVAKREDTFRQNSPGDRDQARQAPAEGATAALSGRAAAVSKERSVVWRLAGGGVERTTNGGASWTGRFQPADVSLRAIAGPSATVCWAVGDEGAVYLTRDGQTWTRIAFPERVALAEIDAADAERAVVAARDGRRFETTDGGVQWRALP